VYYQNSIFFQLQEGGEAWPPDQGLCPCTPLGALPQTPVIDPRSALAMSSPAVQKKSPPLHEKHQILFDALYTPRSLVKRVLSKTALISIADKNRSTFK